MSEQLLDQIREAKPVAPDELRERVASIAVEQPARESLLDRFRPRRLLLVAPVALVTVLLAAGVIANLPDNGTRSDDASVAVGADERRVVGRLGAAVDQGGAPRPDAGFPAAGSPPLGTTGSGALAPSVGRLQRFQAEMRLRVEDVEELSAATKSAMRIAQSLRGYVVSVQYDAPAQGVGGAQIVLRVPTARVQTALTQLSALGTILGQRIGIEDLQQPADDLTAQIEETQREIARLQVRLREHRTWRRRSARCSRRGSPTRAAGSQTCGARSPAPAREARFATIQLGLTTEPIEPAAVARTAASTT